MVFCMKKLCSFALIVASFASFMPPAGASTVVWGPYAGDDALAERIPCVSTEWGGMHHDWTDWSGFPWEALIGVCFDQATGKALRLQPGYSLGPIALEDGTQLYPLDFGSHPVLESTKVIPWGRGEAFSFRARIKGWPCANLKCRPIIVELQALIPYRGNYRYQYLIDGNLSRPRSPTTGSAPLAHPREHRVLSTLRSTNRASALTRR